MLVIRADVICTNGQMAKEEVTRCHSQPPSHASHKSHKKRASLYVPNGLASTHKTNESTTPTRLDHNLSNPNGSCFTANIGPCGKPHVNRMPCTGPTDPTHNRFTSLPNQDPTNSIDPLETHTVILAVHSILSSNTFWTSFLGFLGLTHFCEGASKSPPSAAKQQKNLHNLPVCLATNALSYSAPSPAVSGMRNWNKNEILLRV